jgi:hypothetical protein
MLDHNLTVESTSKNNNIKDRDNDALQQVPFIYNTMGSLPKEESINALQENDGEINEEVSESKEKIEACKKSNIKSSDMVKDSKENEKNSNPVLSKKALKRQRRWEEKLATKKRRKEHDKESKKAKAILEGRDLEKERREVELRTKNGEGRKRREKVCLYRYQYLYFF